MTRTVRVFRPAAERLIERQFGIVRPVTDAVRLLRAGQENTDRWLIARSATIGASEISILMMAEHPYHSPFSLWHVKAHGWGHHEQTHAQERGHLLEEGTARRFAAAHPELIVARPNGALWRDPDHPALSCTPDFLTIDEDGLIAPLETKSDEGGDGWGPGEEEVPPQYWWQVQQQMGVFAAPHGYVARWNSRGYRDYTIGHDRERYGRAAAVAAAFLNDVREGVCPPVDEHRSTRAVLVDRAPHPVYAASPVQLPAGWGEELAALKASRAEIDKQIKGIENRIRERLAASPIGYDLSGRTYTRTRTERRGYTAPPTVLDQIRTTEPKGTP